VTLAEGRRGEARRGVAPRSDVGRPIDELARLYQGFYEFEKSGARWARVFALSPGDPQAAFHAGAMCARCA
jgi:hypothetical protein